MKSAAGPLRSAAHAMIAAGDHLSRDTAGLQCNSMHQHCRLLPKQCHNGAGTSIDHSFQPAESRLLFARDFMAGIASQCAHASGGRFAHKARWVKTSLTTAYHFPANLQPGASTIRLAMSKAAGDAVFTSRSGVFGFELSDARHAQQFCNVHTVNVYQGCWHICSCLITPSRVALLHCCILLLLDSGGLSGCARACLLHGLPCAPCCGCCA